MYRFLDFDNKEKILKVIKENDDFDYKDENFMSTSFYSIFDNMNNEVGFFGLESREYNLCLCYFYIYPPFRNMGYAKQVLEEIINDFKDKYGYIYGLVNEKNKRAIEIYQNYMFLFKNMKFDKIKDFDDEKENLYSTKIGDVTCYEVCFNFNQTIYKQNQMLIK
jgi:ribosomal protein S18 acetylase RimI-like enzyme